MDLSDAARLIEQSPDFHLLRRVPPVAQWNIDPTASDIRRAVFVDTETTGLDHATDEVIELALLPFEYERETGRIVRVDEAGALSALRQPSFPIPEESARVHGITDADVAGKTIEAEAVRAIVEPAQLIIAHNAAFDRPMVEKLWPIFEQKHWACSFVDIDWKAEGLGSAKLDYLLMKAGWFHDGHRALSDALATVFLLTQPLPGSGRSGLKALLDCARKPLWAVRAEGTAFEQRAALKARNYRWDDGEGKRRKAWWILTDDPQGEIDWLEAEIYQAPTEIPIIKMPATMRYSARLWSD